MTALITTATGVSGAALVASAASGGRCEVRLGRLRECVGSGCGTGSYRITIIEQLAHPSIVLGLTMQYTVDHIERMFQ